MVGELTTVGLGLDTPGHKVTLSMARSEEIELRETMDVCTWGSYTTQLLYPHQLR